MLEFHSFFCCYRCLCCRILDLDLQLYLSKRVHWCFISPEISPLFRGFVFLGSLLKYPRGANASFCVVCCVKLYFVFLVPSLVKMFHLCPACNQDVHPSKGKFLCCARLYMCALYPTYVCVHVHCVCNFRAVKMLHLSAASRQDVPSFGEESCVCMCVCMCIVCATFVLSRCCIFWQLLVKMFHLSARKVAYVCVCACALCVQLSCCQDVPSFGSFSSRCHVLAVSCQDTHFLRGKL